MKKRKKKRGQARPCFSCAVAPTCNCNSPTCARFISYDDVVFSQASFSARRRGPSQSLAVVVVARSVAPSVRRARSGTQAARVWCGDGSLTAVTRNTPPSTWRDGAEVFVFRFWHTNSIGLSPRFQRSSLRYVVSRAASRVTGKSPRPRVSKRSPDRVTSRQQSTPTRCLI